MTSSSNTGTNLNDSSESSMIGTWTRDFRQEALQLSSSSAFISPISWEVSQYLLDKVWLDNHQSDPATPHYAKSSGSNGSTTTTSRTIWGCSECGSILQPGLNGTSLCVQRLSAAAKTKPGSKTLKRRLLRKKKQIALLQQKQAKDSNLRKNKQQQQPPNNSSSQLEHSTKLVLLEDDPNLVLERHCLRVQCGRCTAKTYLLGLKRESEPNKKAIQQQQQRQPPEIRSAPRKVKGGASPADTSEEFLALPPAPSKAPTTSMGVSRRQKQQQHPTLLQKGKKKKPPASKGGANKKNKLMSFLSSLND